MGVVFQVGIDDTDAGSSIGTGALARELMLLLARELSAHHMGITRHQLLIHPDIPYTSHNSAACLQLETAVDAEQLARACERFLRYLFHPGADPGLCVMRMAEELPAELLSFGQRAQQQIVCQQEAADLARRHRVLLRELGGSGQGIIGALSACALRCGRDDGRFIDLAGLRGMRGPITVAQLRAAAPIDRVVDSDGNELEEECSVETNGWVRPELRAGAIVLHVQRDARSSGFYIERARYESAASAKGRARRGSVT